jgi:hypothetical protein
MTFRLKFVKLVTKGIRLCRGANNGYTTQFSSHRDVLNQFSQNIENSKTTLKNLNTQYNIKPNAAVDQFLSLQLLIRLNLNVNTAPKNFHQKQNPRIRHCTINFPFIIEINKRFWN